MHLRTNQELLRVGGTELPLTPHNVVVLGLWLFAVVCVALLLRSLVRKYRA